MIIKDIFWNYRKNIYNKDEVFRKKSTYLFFTIPSLVFALALILVMRIWHFPKLWFGFFGFFLVFLFFIYKFFKINSGENDVEKLRDDFLALKNIENPDFFTLKKQDLILKEIFAIYPTVQYSVIRGKRFNFYWETYHINEEIENFLKNHQNDPRLEIQKHISEVFEHIVLGNWDFSDEDIIKNHYEKSKIFAFIRSMVGGFQISIIPVTLLMIFFYLDPSGDEANFKTYLATHGIFTFFIWLIVWLNFLQKPLLLNRNLDNHFFILQNATKTYLEIISRENIHHADQLLFAELINYFSENILNREKNLKKYEKMIKKRYCYFYILRFSIPEEIKKFFEISKIQLRDDAILVQKIIEKWAEIEKTRLEKNSQNSNHPAIIASEKRRELMIKNLENISKQ